MLWNKLKVLGTAIEHRQTHSNLCFTTLTCAPTLYIFQYSGLNVKDLNTPALDNLNSLNFFSFKPQMQTNKNILPS